MLEFTIEVPLAATRFNTRVVPPINEPIPRTDDVPFTSNMFVELIKEPIAFANPKPFELITFICEVEVANEFTDERPIAVTIFDTEIVEMLEEVELVPSAFNAFVLYIIVAFTKQVADALISFTEVELFAAIIPDINELPSPGIRLEPLILSLSDKSMSSIAGSPF
jgi:hypothetical protein